MSDSVLVIRLRKRLPDFSLDIALQAGGGVTVLFGPSGGGKSMTLQAVAGLLRPDAGRIAINGHVLYDSEAGIHLPPQQRRVGFVMQDYALFPHMTIAQNIAYGLAGLPKSDRRQAVDKMLRLMELDGLEARRPSQLSGGQQQRVALARALVTRPQVLLLDEPLAALDVALRQGVRQELRKIQERFQVPILFVTHDLAEAHLLADRIAVIHQGRVLQIGPSRHVVYHPATLEVARATGARNILQGVVTGASPQDLQVRVGELTLTTPAFPFTEGQVVHLTIRPEQVVLLKRERLEGEENPLHGRIISEMTDGLTYHLLFRADGPRLAPEVPHDLEIILPPHVYDTLGIAQEKQWHVAIRPQGIHLIAANQGAWKPHQQGIFPDD